MPVTIHDVAKAAGLSIATVSRALNNTGHAVSDEKRQLIHELAAEMGYQPNEAARSLRTDRSQIIGVIVDDITTPFTPIIIRGIQDTLKAAGYSCVILNTDWDPEVEKEAIRKLAQHSIKGIIFVETWHRQATSELGLNDKKVVFVHRLFSLPSLYSIVPDEIYGARLATQHLVDLGHQRIAYINGPMNYYASTDRLKGYQSILHEAGIAFDESIIARGDWEVRSGFEAALRLLDHPERPTALFAANDKMALGAIYAAQKLGLRIPYDLAVVGYDDTELASLVQPMITTVTLPCYEMGEAAARMLLELLAGSDDYKEEQRIRGELMIRESCGATAPQSGRKLKPTAIQRRLTMMS